MYDWGLELGLAGFSDYLYELLGEEEILLSIDLVAQFVGEGEESVVLLHASVGGIGPEIVDEGVGSDGEEREGAEVLHVVDAVVELGGEGGEAVQLGDEHGAAQGGHHDQRHRVRQEHCRLLQSRVVNLVRQ